MALSPELKERFREEPYNEMDDYDDYDTYGCVCHHGHPPCGFCESLTEEEVEIYDAEGASGVYDHRSGERQIRIDEEKAMIANPKYGRF